MYRRSCGRTYCRTDRCIKTSPHRLYGGEAHHSGLRTTTSPPVLPESQAVGRGVPPYSEYRRTCPRMACAGPQPTGIRAIYDPHRVDWMDHLLGSTSSRRGSRGFFFQLKQITDSESLFTALQSLSGTFFSPGSPWRARAVREPLSSRRRQQWEKG